MGAALRPWANHRPAGRHARLGPAREPCRGLRAAQGIANNRTVHVYSARRAPKLGAFWCRFRFPLSPRLRALALPLLRPLQARVEMAAFTPPAALRPAFLVLGRHWGNLTGPQALLRPTPAPPGRLTGLQP